MPEAIKKGDYGSLTRQRALNTVEMGEAVGPTGTLGPRPPRGDGPQVGLQTVERCQAAVKLHTNTLASLSARTGSSFSHTVHTL